MDSKYFYKNVLPVLAMIAVGFGGVGLNVLFKAASAKGMSYFVFLFYSYIINTLLLFPISIFLCRRTMMPLFKFPLLSRLCAIGIVGFSAQWMGYKGLKYSTPTMASVMSNLIAAWTFLFAVLFRMEKLALRSKVTQSKIIGTILSISGAFVMVFYRGPAILSNSHSSLLHILPHKQMASAQSNWVVGGILLAAQHILYAFSFIIQTQIMQICPSPLLMTFFSYLVTTIVSAPVCFVQEPHLNAWKLRPDITLVTVAYSGLVAGAAIAVIHLWCLHLKGPVYVAVFMPLYIAIAAAMSFVFLGDALHLGSVIGAIVISVGVYAVIWGRANEEKAKEELSLPLSDGQKVDEDKSTN